MCFVLNETGVQYIMGNQFFVFFRQNGQRNIKAVTSSFTIQLLEIGIRKHQRNNGDLATLLRRAAINAPQRMKDLCLCGVYECLMRACLNSCFWFRMLEVELLCCAELAEVRAQNLNPHPAVTG